MKSRFLPNVFVLCALLLPGAAGMEVRAGAAVMDSQADSSPRRASASTVPDAAVPSSGLNRLYPEEMDPPGSCGVPLSGPFGQDVEILLNDVQYELEPGWHSQGGIPNWFCLPGGDVRAQPVSDLAAAPLGTERIVAVWREGCSVYSGLLFYNIWDAASGWTAQYSPGVGPLGLTPEGNPAILATGGDGWEVYARDGGQIQYVAWLSPGEFSDWQTVPGTTGVASDPVVVSRGSGHAALFYRDASGGVWFTEREGGVVWRGSPLPLTRHRIFLPTVVKAGSGAAARPPAGQPFGPAAPSSAAFVSELSAISRNENHLAVFGVDDGGQLMVKEWTSRNASDWSDTQWVALMGDVAPEKPGVASRHSNHLAVAVRDTSGVAHTIEWADDTGWGSPASLGETFAGPLMLAATDTDEMFLFGVDEQSVVRSMHWTAGAGWEGPQSRATGGIQDQVIPAVVRRAGDVMILMREGDYGWYAHYSSQDRDPTATDRQFALPQSEVYRNQVLARVGSRSYYLAADEGAGGDWVVEAWDLDGDVAQPGLDLDGHPYAAGSPVSVVAGDLDFDGSDEIVVATYDDPMARLSVLDLLVMDLDAAPTLSMVVTATVTETLTAWDLGLAIGDLDGDLRRNEVILAATKVAEQQAVAKLYQFLPGAPAELREKSDGFDVIDDLPPLGLDPELEAAAGRLYPGYGEQLAVAFTGDIPFFTGTGWVNTYGIVAGEEPWTLELVGDNLARDYGDVVVGQRYRSALATGDLDADGYDEIAASYLDRVYVIDPNGPGGLVDSIGIPTWPFLPPQERSLAVGDLDRDGRAEIAVAGYPLLLGFRYVLVELVGDGELALAWGPEQPGRTGGTVLVGDVDGDGLVSELVGCNTAGEYSVVAVVNGLPRWYEDGVPVFDSTGSYSVEEGGGSSQETGTTFSLGASLSVGYETEINIPFVGTVAEFRSSVTQDFLQSSGVSQEREVIEAYGANYEFDQGLGLVVYNLVDTTCYYYDVFPPEDPLETSRAMSCKPGANDTLVMTLEQWHEQSTQDAATWSWVDVGHRSPGGALTNDLLEPGNYRPVLPVDEFLLVFEFDPQHIAETGGAQESWYASQATGGARTVSTHVETNTTASVGSTVGGVSVDVSATFGMGWDNSHTMSWSDTIAFAGGYSWAGGGGYPSYWVAPYAYQATAVTLAGTTYPYWAMDYYVTSIGP
jgi:hypothetical protein